MLSSIRKFSNTILAKIFLAIVAIPFIFWGMGDLFSTGSKNTIATIGKDKIHIQEFIKHVNNYTSINQEVDEKVIDELLGNFIGNKLIEREIVKFNILLSDASLKKIIKNQRLFKKDNKFSRIEYEKFLVKNGLSAVIFESNISQEEKKKQLLELVGGGIFPPLFLTDLNFGKINQKRNIEYINLNNAFLNDINFTQNQIKSYFEKNKENYKKIYKSIKFVKLSAKNLTGNDDYSDLFFQKIDEIDDSIFNGENLEYILKKYDLQNPSSLTFDMEGQDKNLKKIDIFTEKDLKKIFEINNSPSTILLQTENEYFVVEIFDTESIQGDVNSQGVKKNVLLNLQKESKRKLIVNLINKINQNNFSKKDFVKFSTDKKIKIIKLRLDSQNDDKNLDKGIIKQIYSHPEKKTIIVADIGLEKSYLVFIEKVENIHIEENSEYYEKYFNLSKSKIKNDLYNTYDLYLKKKYEIDINYNALNSIKNNLK